MILYCTFTGYHHTQKLCKSQSLDFDIYRLSFSQFKCYRVRPIIRHLQPPTHLFTHCLISSNWEGFLNMSTMFLRLSTHSFTHVLVSTFLVWLVDCQSFILFTVFNMFGFPISFFCFFFFFLPGIYWLMRLLVRNECSFTGLIDLKCN